MLYIILTLGKSGSSLLASTFHNNGIPAFNSMLNNGDNSQRYEDSALCSYNRSLFGANNHSLSMGYPIIINMDDNAKSQMNNIINKRFLKSDNYCAKDPRMSYVYKYWKQVLPEHKVVIQFRNPKEVAAHYHKKNEYSKVIKNVCERYKYVYTSAINNADNPLFVSYDSLRDNDLSHLEQLLGIKLKSQYENAKYRQRAENLNVNIDEKTNDIYNKMLDLEKIQKEKVCQYAKL